MFGHPSEHLFWAPDPRDDLAFTLYAIDIEEQRDAKDQIIAGLQSGEYAPQSSFEQFKAVMEDVFPVSRHFSAQDWADIKTFW